jgi:uncharacterized membrane protein YccC
VLAVTLAAAGMAVSTFVGATADATAPWLLVPVIFAWAYTTGLIAALGPTALAVALQWPVALLIGSALPLAPGPAAVRGLLVLAGGLWQGLLVVSSWAVGRGSAERSAVAASFLALSEYAAGLAAGSHEPPSAATIAGRYALKDPNPLMRDAVRLHLLDLTEEADRLRASMTALGVGRTADRPGAGGRRLLTAAGAVLTELAAALTEPVASRAAHEAAARGQLAAASAESGTPFEWAGEALLGQLRSAYRITVQLNDAEPARPRSRPGQPVELRMASSRDAALTLRASLGTSSEAGRHALRLAVVTAVAEVIVRAADVPHGYWGVLTIFIVLRPDYSSTLYRGLQRAAGTLVGAGLGVLTVLLGHLGIGVLLGGIALSLLAAYATFTVNYLLYAVFLTDFVVVLLALLGLPPGPTAEARLVGTGIGTALALLAYVLWPTWEGSTASEKFARLFTAQGRYAHAMLHAYTRPAESGPAERPDLQVAVRRARIDADASADRLAGEPDHPPMTGELARSLIAAGHRISQACIALGAVLAAHRAAPPQIQDAGLQPRLDAFADVVRDSTGHLAANLRGVGPPDARLTGPPLALLRVRQRAIWADGKDPLAGARDSQADLDPVAASNSEEAGLFAATDGLVDAINTVAHVLRGEDPAR